MRRVVLPTLGYSDVEEVRCEQVLLEQRRLAELRWRAPKQTKRVRPGEEPSAAQEDALLLYARTHGF